MPIQREITVTFITDMGVIKGLLPIQSCEEMAIHVNIYLGGHGNYFRYIFVGMALHFNAYLGGNSNYFQYRFMG